VNEDDNDDAKDNGAMIMREAMENKNLNEVENMHTVLENMRATICMVRWLVASARIWKVRHNLNNCILSYTKIIHVNSVSTSTSS